MLKKILRKCGEFERSTKLYQQEDKSCVIKMEGLSLSGCEGEYRKVTGLLWIGIFFTYGKSVLAPRSSWIFSFAHHSQYLESDVEQVQPSNTAFSECRKTLQQSSGGLLLEGHYLSLYKYYFM